MPITLIATSLSIVSNLSDKIQIGKLSRHEIIISELEDIYELLRLIDNITDAIEEISLRLYLYNYIMKLSEETGKMPHDILGYVDKDTESYSNGSISQPETISNADIYDNWED